MLPSVVARQVRETILDYLASAFGLAEADGESSLLEFLDGPEGVFRGPYLAHVGSSLALSSVGSRTELIRPRPGTRSSSAFLTLGALRAPWARVSPRLVLLRIPTPSPSTAVVT
jgi:hypothetical protein